MNYKLSCYFSMLLQKWNTDIDGSLQYLDFLLEIISLEGASFFNRWEWVFFRGRSIFRWMGAPHLIWGRCPPHASPLGETVTFLSLFIAALTYHAWSIWKCMIKLYQSFNLGYMFKVEIQRRAKYIIWLCLTNRTSCINLV